eukprot:1329912-Lingulodinium_polyedra.AAC.1
MCIRDRRNKARATYAMRNNAQTKHTNAQCSNNRTHRCAPMQQQYNAQQCANNTMMHNNAQPIHHNTPWGSRPLDAMAFIANGGDSFVGLGAGGFRIVWWLRRNAYPFLFIW